MDVSDVKGTGFIVDFPVRNAFINSLSVAYSDQSWLLNTLKISEDSNNDDHPLNKAFNAVRKWSALTEGLRLATSFNINDLIQHLKSRSLAEVDEETALNRNRQPWCNAANNEILQFSAEDLIEVAVTAAKSAITMGEKYINGEIRSFDYCGVPFLERDYNIDTGLPSDENTNIDLRNGQERFSLGTSILLNNYHTYRG